MTESSILSSSIRIIFPFTTLVVSTEDWKIFKRRWSKATRCFPLFHRFQAAQNYDVDAFLDAKAKKAVLALQLGGTFLVAWNRSGQSQPVVNVNKFRLNAREEDGQN